MKKVSLMLLMLMLLSFIFSQDKGMVNKVSSDSKRIALVIGNADYEPEAGGRLINTRNDALDIAATLKNLGFELVGGKAHLNLNLRQIDELVREFGKRIKNGGVGLFYFSGHGVQDNRANYLIPLGAKIEKEQDVRFEAYEVGKVLAEMEAAENGLNILILDACRNNPFSRGFRSGGQNGLATIANPPIGTYLAFAAGEGQTASDNPNGRNGLYTQELLKNLNTEGLRLEDIFINTRRGVRQQSNNRQIPWEYGSIDGVFYFKESTAQTPLKPVATPNTVANNQPTTTPATSTNSRRSFSFTTPRTDAKGNIVEQIPGSAFYEVEDLENGVTLEMVEINGYSGGKFWAGKYEVTQAQWKAVMGNEDFKKRNCNGDKFTSEFIGSNKPMICVSWDDAQEFIKRLNLKTGKKYRLPSEEEWEYAARGGAKTNYTFGENITSDLANFDGKNPKEGAHKGRFIEHITSVGSYPANNFGLFDVQGNVSEWCEWDNISLVRIFRGGGWSYWGDPLILNNRFSASAPLRVNNLGFRLFRSE